jgi:hypothetical protein
MVVVWLSFASEKATAHPVWRVESAQREHGLDGPGSGCARDDEVEQAILGSEGRDDRPHEVSAVRAEQ